MGLTVTSACCSLILAVVAGYAIAESLGFSLPFWLSQVCGVVCIQIYLPLGRCLFC